MAGREDHPGLAPGRPAQLPSQLVPRPESRAGSTLIAPAQHCPGRNTPPRADHAVLTAVRRSDLSDRASPGEDRMPTPADFQAMRDAYDAVAPDPAHFDEFAAKNSTLVHEFPGWTDELRSLQVPTLLIFGDRDFFPLPDVVEMFELLPNAELALLPGTTHVGVTRRPGEGLALITPFLDAC